MGMTTAMRLNVNKILKRVSPMIVKCREEIIPIADLLRKIK